MPTRETVSTTTSPSIHPHRYARPDGRVRQAGAAARRFIVRKLAKGQLLQPAQDGGTYLNSVITVANADGGLISLEQTVTTHGSAVDSELDTNSKVIFSTTNPDRVVGPC